MNTLMNTLSFLDGECSVFADTDTNDSFVAILGVVRLAVRILQILVPIALILWGTIDIGKAVIAGDEKKMKEAQKPFVKRVIAAIIVFLIPFLVTLIMNYFTDGEWHNCWDAAKTAGKIDTSKIKQENQYK